MSEPTIDEERERTKDPLLAALRELPVRTMDSGVEARLERQARATYLRGFEGSAWSSASGRVGRFAVPVFLAGVVGVYMTWAIAAATALVH